jgi:alcohol dehydrogenase, propanol-preferring
VQALVLERPAAASAEPLSLCVVPDPRPARGELLLRVAACGVCRTDLQLAEGDLAARTLPIIPGHQTVGRVEEVGPGVTDWELGERAGVTWLAGACGHCRFCLMGRENLCPLATFTGWERNGGFAELTTVRADVAVRLPDAIGDVAAAPLLCGGVIGFRSLRVCGIQPGGRLGLFGFGASARCAIQVAVHWGCEVFVATRSESEQRRALELGAVWAGRYDDPPPEPLDAAITFAPSGDVVVAALRALARGGTVAINAIHLDRMPEFPYDLIWWERCVRSVANVTREDARDFIALAASIPVRADIELRALTEGNLALQRIASGAIRGAAVLVPWKVAHYVAAGVPRIWRMCRAVSTAISARMAATSRTSAAIDPLASAITANRNAATTRPASTFVGGSAPGPSSAPASTARARMTTAAQRWLSPISGTPHPAYVVTSTPTTRTASVTTVRSLFPSVIDPLLSASEHRACAARRHRRTPVCGAGFPRRGSAGDSRGSQTAAQRRKSAAGAAIAAPAASPPPRRAL